VLNNLTSTARVEPSYIPADDKREFWIEIRRGVCVWESAVNKRARHEHGWELLLWGKCLGAVKLALSAHLGLE